jgi:hypothetical protein
MNCPTDASVAVTPETVRAESWLALVAGARGLGFFPAAWTGDVGGVIRRIRDEVGALVPALVQPVQPVTLEPADTSVRAAAWTTGGAVYVAAVNAGTAAADVTLRFSALGNRTVSAIGENRQLQSSDGTLADHLEPLQVHVYVAGP